MNAPELREKLAQLVANYPHPQAALVPALHLLRDEGGSITGETLAVIVDACKVEAQHVSEICSYYSMFNGSSANHASLCMGLICYLHGAKEIFDDLKAEPRSQNPIEHVKVSTCLGYCHAAPVMALADGTICKITKSN